MFLLPGSQAKQLGSHLQLYSNFACAWGSTAAAATPAVSASPPHLGVSQQLVQEHVDVGVEDDVLQNLQDSLPRRCLQLLIAHAVHDVIQEAGPQLAALAADMGWCTTGK
jgi:hypothetical protein